MATNRDKTEALFLTVRTATAYLGCSREELLAWVEPDRRLPDDVGPLSGTRLWQRATLDAVRPQVAAWRERDRVAAADRAAEIEAQQAAAKARRKGMRKGGAVTAKVVRERLQCSAVELDRWAADGRLPPDGEIVLAGLLPKTVHARAWLPATIAAAKAAIDDWRAQDRAKTLFKRRGLRPVE